MRSDDVCIDGRPSHNNFQERTVEINHVISPMTPRLLKSTEREWDVGGVGGGWRVSHALPHSCVESVTHAWVSPQ